MRLQRQKEDITRLSDKEVCTGIIEHPLDRHHEVLPRRTLCDPKQRRANQQPLSRSTYRKSIQTHEKVDPSVPAVTTPLAATMASMNGKNSRPS